MAVSPCVAGGQDGLIPAAVLTHTMTEALTGVKEGSFSPLTAAPAARHQPPSLAVPGGAGLLPAGLAGRWRAGVAGEWCPVARGEKCV